MHGFGTNGVKYSCLRSIDSKEPSDEIGFLCQGSIDPCGESGEVWVFRTENEAAVRLACLMEVTEMAAVVSQNGPFLSVREG